MYTAGFELTIPDSGGGCSHHCAMEVYQFIDTVVPIYRQLILIINLNKKTVSMQSELFSCLPTM